MEAKEQGLDIRQKKYYMGGDMHEILDEIRANPI
jgi:hypothetical protein